MITFLNFNFNLENLIVLFYHWMQQMNFQFFMKYSEISSLFVKLKKDESVKFLEKKI